MGLGYGWGCLNVANQHETEKRQAITANKKKTDLQLLDGFRRGALPKTY
jgi:hypothetical protein